MNEVDLLLQEHCLVENTYLQSRNGSFTYRNNIWDGCLTIIGDYSVHEKEVAEELIAELEKKKKDFL